MVKAPPSSSLVVAEAKFLLEVVGDKVESQYWVGSGSPFGHSTRSHSSGRGVGRL